MCPYHAWEYDSSGQCVLIPANPNQPPPAKARAQTYHAREQYGMIWVCLGEPLWDLPEFTYGDDPAFRLMLAGPYFFHAQGPRVIENFFDVAHLGFVHAGLLGDPQHGEIEDYEVEIGPDGPEAREIRIWQPDPDGTGTPALVTYHYWARGPLTVGPGKGTMADSDSAFLRRWHRWTRELRVAAGDRVELRSTKFPTRTWFGFQDKVTAQDKVVVESQRPELLPLDLQAELHLRSDRMAIAYRKWLREIGFSYGIA